MFTNSVFLKNPFSSESLSLSSQPPLADRALWSSSSSDSEQIQADQLHQPSRKHKRQRSFSLVGSDEEGSLKRFAADPLSSTPPFTPSGLAAMQKTDDISPLFLENFSYSSDLSSEEDVETQASLVKCASQLLSLDQAHAAIKQLRDWGFLVHVKRRELEKVIIFAEKNLQHVQPPHFFRSSQVGYETLPFSLLVDSGRDGSSKLFMLFNREAHFGKLGEGSVKTAKLALNLCSGDPHPFYVSLIAKNDRPANLRIQDCGFNTLQRLSDIEGVLQVESPHILSYVSHKDSADKQLYMTQLCNQRSLYDLLQPPHRFTSEEKAEIAHSLLSTLTQLHARGLFHGDLKPENIFLHRSQEGAITALLGDFDISIFTTAEEKISYRVNRGTFSYFAPEQHLEYAAHMFGAGEQTVFLTQKQLFARDLYALGVILAYLFRSRFQELSTTQTAFFAAFHQKRTADRRAWSRYLQTFIQTHGELPTTKSHFFQQPQDPLSLLIWSLLHPNPTARPTAPQALEKLETIFFLKSTLI